MPLASFATVERAALRWLREENGPLSFSLLAEDRPVATLSWTRRPGSLARGTTADGSWTMKRAGFLSPSVLVRTEGTEPTTVARLHAHLRRHEILLEGGGAYRLQHVSHILPAWTVTTAGGEEVLHIEPAAERGSLKGGAVVVSSHQNAPETLLLVVLSWYFVVLVALEDEVVDVLVPFEGPDAPVRLSWPSRAPASGPSTP